MAALGMALAKAQVKKSGRHFGVAAGFTRVGRMTEGPLPKTSPWGRLVVSMPVCFRPPSRSKFVYSMHGAWGRASGGGRRGRAVGGAARTGVTLGRRCRGQWVVIGGNSVSSFASMMVARRKNARYPWEGVVGGVCGGGQLGWVRG
jgi:hypothetical protein